MSYNHFYKKLDQIARRNFAGLSETPEMTWDHLVSPLEIRLSQSIFKQCQAAIQALHAVSRRPAYRELLEAQPGISDVSSHHESVLMAYDFHTDEEGNASLVEINTNASGFMFSSLMQMVHSGDDSISGFAPLDDLKRSFERDMELARGDRPQTGSLHVAITDEDIPQQKMYSEFLMYRDWFRQLGWTAEFCEPPQFEVREQKLFTPSGTAVDLVYNRLTDFYLESPENSILAEAYRSEIACITPNPREYWLLADKQRLIQFTQKEFLESIGASAEECAAIRRVLIPTYEVTDFESHNEIWQQRRSLFFKPKRSHGGKSVYRGESVSRKVFERLMSEDILIQRFTPAQRVPHDDDRSVLNNWKFDLRFYVYADRIQLWAARIYQGQVTNFASPLGGFTNVRFV